MLFPNFSTFLCVLLHIIPANSPNCPVDQDGCTCQLRKIMNIHTIYKYMKYKTGREVNYCAYFIKCIREEAYLGIENLENEDVYIGSWPITQVV